MTRSYGRAEDGSWFMRDENGSTSLFGFGDAIRFLKEGKRVARMGWNGKGMWLLLVSPMIRGKKHSYGLAGDPDFVMGATPLPWIGMKTADDGFVPWTPSQTDMLAEDWEIV